MPYPQGYHGASPLVGAYRHLRDYCRREKLPLHLIITHAGAGRVLENWLAEFGANLAGWRSLGPVWERLGLGPVEEHYFQDLRWLDQHVYGHDPEVLAFCVYGLNLRADLSYELGTDNSLMNLLGNYLQEAQQDEVPPYPVVALAVPAECRVLVQRLRIRPRPSLNNKFVGGLHSGQQFLATHYAFNDGFLWLRHNQGWSAYAPLQAGNPQYDEKLLEGPLILTPRQEAARNNFVGTLEEVRSFLQAHQGHLFYIAINPGGAPEGGSPLQHHHLSRQIRGAASSDALHPQPGNPRMTPDAKRHLRDKGQL
ncbi:MAG: hypothetical protein HC915_15260 [Anaerolineae bacterium]|nr:hypothetical protein [Anaerolineae bacterium]